MAYQTNKRQDASLGLALMASVACGVGVFLGSFGLFLYLALLSGAVKLHLFEYPAGSNWREVAAIYGSAGLSIAIGILVMRVVFRWVSGSSSDAGCKRLAFGHKKEQIPRPLRRTRNDRSWLVDDGEARRGARRQAGFWRAAFTFSRRSAAVKGLGKISNPLSVRRF